MAAATIAVIDVPDVLGRVGERTEPVRRGIGAEQRLESAGLEFEFAGQRQTLTTAGRKSLLWQGAWTVLGDGNPHLFDEAKWRSMSELVDADQWLTSCDDDCTGGLRAPIWQ